MINRRNYAFTLIELMIVIAIIAVLAALLVPNYMQARQEAQLAACKQNLHEIQTAIQMYRIRNPIAITGISSRSQNISPQCPLIEMGYLKSVPKCPASNATYPYRWETTKLGSQPGATEYDNVYHEQANCHKSLGITGTYPKYDSRYGIIENDPNQ